MTYNSLQNPIVMPEYGRHVQNMVDHAITIEDRAKRNEAAALIIQTMMGLVPSRREGVDGTQVYWDHLAIISRFALDIDYPPGTITENPLAVVSEPLPHTVHRFRYRYYGYIIEEMIEAVCEMPFGPERVALELAIATQMKRGYMTFNSEVVDDVKIFTDLYELSKGRIMLTPENCKININPNSIDRNGKQRVSKRQQGR